MIFLISLKSSTTGKQAEQGPETTIQVSCVEAEY